MAVKPWLSALVPTLVAAVAACSGETARPSPVAPDALSTAASGTITGTVLGPAGSICASLPDGTRLQVLAVNLTTQASTAIQQVFCPSDAYAFSVPDARYLLRVTLPADPAVIADFPWRTITIPAFEVAGNAVARDIPVPVGTPLGGAVTIDGNPLEGISLSLTYDEAPNFAAAALTSGANGTWMDFFGRAPARLQAGIRVRVIGFCNVLGGILERALPSTFLFPDEASGVSCSNRTAPAVRFSHDFTRTVVTPLPGDIGGTDPGLVDQFGMGWGVQFPVNPGTAPAHVPVTRSQLFRGGLLVGIRPDRILSGVDLAGYAQCEPNCRDFGLDARMSFAASPQFGKKVLWQYSDAPSGEGVGLKVQQRSFDGRAPADYVLFRFVFTNSSAVPITFYAGMFADWDIDEDASNDIGATDLDGRLMYTTNVDGGNLVGSLLLSAAPVSGNMFRSLFQSPAPMSEYVAAMAGDIRVPSVDSPGDYLTLHAVGPITLAAGASDEVWIAIVAGEDLSQIRANAAAAEADVARRRASPGAPDELSETTVVRTGAQQKRTLMPPTCKAGCRQP